MKITVFPTVLNGITNAPASKSITHRALICASFCRDKSIIKNPLIANDTLETIEALKNLGARILLTKNTIEVEGIQTDPHLFLSFKESASSLRMILPYVLFKRGKTTIGLNDVLLRRLTPQELLLFDEAIIDNTGMSLTCSFNFDKKVYNIIGNATSQWASGFLLLLPILDNKKVFLDDKLLNNPYLILTKEVMSQFGVTLIQEDSYFSSSSSYQSTNTTIEGDWSNAALWLLLNFLGSNIEIMNLNENSLQGDREITNIINKLKQSDDITIDLSNNLDLALVVAAASALRVGVTTLTGLKRLTHKESNRFQVILDLMEAFDIKTIHTDNQITIYGCQTLKGGLTIDSYNDHRVIMALLILASKCEKPITILNAEAINKSYPTLYDDYIKVGGLLKKEITIDKSSK
ncbi:MAG: 3-phosphoshikimate 1-carboxyvinyltransferase [Bacilli bacterium]|nr:hypothetical protein [Acholeplasmataceae bacterium]